MPSHYLFGAGRHRLTSFGRIINISRVQRVLTLASAATAFCQHFARRRTKSLIY
jgi:hypothetical protein